MPSISGLATGVQVRGVQYKKNAYKWNGRNQMRTVDGETWTMAGIKRYRFIPAVAAGGAGTPSGTYYYYLVPTNEKKIVINANGRARPTQGVPSLRSKAVTLTSQIGSITGIPIHADPQVTHWYVYRNRNGAIDTNLEDETQDYFLVGTVANGTTTFSDNLGDIDLLGKDQILFNLNTPPVFYTGDIYGERLIGGGFTSFTATATKSDLGSGALTKTKTNGICTITTNANHGQAPGTWVTINIGDPRFDGAAFLLTGTINSTLVYHLPGSDVSATAASGSIQIVAFSSGQHDGIIGCWLKPSGSSEAYRIVGENLTSGSIPNGTIVTNVALDRAPSTTISATTVTIYRNPWEVYLSEFMNFENWGPDGETARWVREVPGKESVTCIISFGGRCLIGTADNIYAIEGKGSDVRAVKFLPEPIFRGLGIIGPNAACMVDDDLYIVTKRGPYRIGPQWDLEPIGIKLNTDWLDGLTAAERFLVTIGTDSQRVWVDYPVTGGTVCSETFVLDRKNQAGWWQESGRFVTMSFKDKGLPYYAQGSYIIQPNTGTLDSTTQTGLSYFGAATAGTTTTLTDTEGPFPTATVGNVVGLEECAVMLFDANGIYQGTRRITSNTASVLTIDSGAAVQVGWLYVIGTPAWIAKTKTLETATKAQRVLRAELKFSEVSTYTVYRIEQINGTLQATSHSQLSNEEVAYFEANTRCWDYAIQLISRDNGRVRHLVIKDALQEAKK